MNINEYNKNKNSQNNNQNNTNNRKKKKKFRFDKLIGYITIITIIVFTLMIYNDYKNVAKANNKEEVLADYNDKTSAATIAGTKAQTSVTRDKKIVCIDAGHGGTDGGAQFNNYSEKDQTLEISKLVQKELEAKGIKVVMTRTTDETIPLENRLDIAKKANAGIIVSIHRNYYENSSSVNGVEAWIHSAGPADAKSLAGDILTQLTKISGVTNRGIKTGTMANAKSNYSMNSDSLCTSCIIELGFISNAADNTLVTTNKSQCAKSIAQGILNYINEVEK